jgi:hypothetical protein
MSRYINKTIKGYNEFVANYVAITNYRVPNLDEALTDHAMGYLSTVAPDKFPDTHIPAFRRTYGKRTRREFAFDYRWNESAEQYDIHYRGFEELTKDEGLEFHEVKFERWEVFAADYENLAKPEHTSQVDDLRYIVLKELCGKGGAPEHGRVHKVWLKATDSKNGSRCWFNMAFVMEDKAPVIRYEGCGALELKAYDVAAVRFEGWIEFEETYKKLVKPEFHINFEEQKGGFAKECAANKESGHRRQLWVGRNATVSRRAYRFWFHFSNEDGLPMVQYSNYGFD